MKKGAANMGWGGGRGVAQLMVCRAGIFKKSMGARNRGGIGLSYRPARLHRLGEFTLESIPGLHKRLKIRAQVLCVTEPKMAGVRTRGKNPLLRQNDNSFPRILGNPSSCKTLHFLNFLIYEKKFSKVCPQCLTVILHFSSLMEVLYSTVSTTQQKLNN
jgi:hypothetical protein